MGTLQRIASVATISLITLATSACGSHPALMPARVQPASVIAQSVPPQSQFKTVKAIVQSVLPDDTTGLPHQNFVVVTDSGEKLTVNNDTKYGSRVPGLKAGLKLVIRGVEYHGANANGIHWTHHANTSNDAGFIITPDGKIYQ